MTVTKLRVLLLIDAFRMGGAETLLAPLAVALRNRDVEIEFVSVLSGSEDAIETVQILRSSGVTTKALNVKRLADPMAIPRIAREIRAGKYDVVHAHLESATILAALAAPLARRPVVCTFHHVARPVTGREHVREKLAVFAATRGEYAVFVSEASRTAFADIYRRGDVPPNWLVVHNGIDTSGFAPGQSDRRVRVELSEGLAADPQRPLVVIPAAFRDFKGHADAIGAWQQVVQSRPDAILSLVGGGSLEPELRSQVRSLGLETSIKFAGVRSDMPEVFRAADAVLLPSTHGENLPTVLMEASAAGRPLAASRVGGIPDIVVDGETGVLFDPGDRDGLARAVASILGNRGFAAGLAAAAVERANAKFSAHAWAATLHQLYLSMLHEDSALERSV